jgi:ABC-type phosphate transport system auxiliary subunit
MSRDAEYAQKQFNAEKADQAKSGQMDCELRTLRKKVQALEEKVSSLSTELSMRRVIGENKRGFS